MKNFVEFVLEAKKAKEKGFNLNDAKGKLNEILTGSHLQHGTHMSGMPNKFLSHYRDEDGKSPEEIHNSIKADLDTRYPGLYNTINDHSRHASEFLKKKLEQNGHHTINDVAWTSQAGDHHRFTGQNDPNSDADIMVQSNKGPVGISMKYGTSTNMNLRNNGLDKLEQTAGIKQGDLTGAREAHSATLKKLGIVNHDDYKKKRDSDDPANQEAVAAAEESALNAQKTMAGHLSNGLSKMNTEQLRDYVNNTVSPQTKFQHFRMHTQPANDGVNSAVSHHFDDVQSGRHKLDDFEELRAKPHSGAISAQIEGRRKGAASFEPILDQSIKKGSGPTKGFASTAKAPYLTKKVVQPKLLKQITPSGIDKPKAKVVANPAKEAVAKPKPIKKILGAVNTTKSPTKAVNKITNDGTVGGFRF